jgi:hypothetical protein
VTSAGSVTVGSADGPANSADSAADVAPHGGSVAVGSAVGVPVSGGAAATRSGCDSGGYHLPSDAIHQPGPGVGSLTVSSFHLPVDEAHVGVVIDRHLVMSGPVMSGPVMSGQDGAGVGDARGTAGRRALRPTTRPPSVFVDFAGGNPDNPTMDLLSGGGLSIIPIALVVAVGVFFGLAAVVAIFVVIVVANRADPDPSGRRPLAVYLFGVSFFSLFITLFGTFAMVLGLVQLIGSHPGVVSTERHPVGDSVARTVVLGGIVVAVAVVLLTASLRRALRLPEMQAGQPGPVGRVAQSYAASVSFVCIFIAAVSVIVFLYEVVRILAPGVFELSGSRVGAARVVLSALYLTLASGAIVAAHARLLPDGGWRTLTGADGGAGVTFGAYPIPPPPPA